MGNEKKLYDKNPICEMYNLLKGAKSAIEKGIPFVPADNEAHYMGEWLSEINEFIAKIEER